MARGTGARDAAAGADAVIAGASAYKRSQDSDRDYDYKKQEDERKAKRQALQDEVDKRVVESNLRGQELHQKLLGAQLANDFPFLESRPDDPKGNNIPTGLAVPNTEAQKMGSINDSRTAAGFAPVSSMDEFLPQRDVAAYKLGEDTGKAKLAQIQAQTGAEKSKAGYYDQKDSNPNSPKNILSQVTESYSAIQDQMDAAQAKIASGDPAQVREGKIELAAAQLTGNHLKQKLDAQAKGKTEQNNFTVTHTKDGPQLTAKVNNLDDALAMQDQLAARSGAQPEIQKASLAAARADQAAAEAPDEVPWYKGGGLIPFVHPDTYKQSAQAAATSAHAGLAALQKFGNQPPAAQDSAFSTPSPDQISAATSSKANELNAPAPAIAPTQSKEASVVSSQKDFDALPKGAQYYNKIKGRYETKP